MSASPFPDLRVDEEQYPKYIVVRKIHPSNKVFSTYFKGAVVRSPFGLIIYEASNDVNIASSACSLAQGA